MRPTAHCFFDDPLGLDPLSPLPSRDPRWFIPAHAGGGQTTGFLAPRGRPAGRRAPSFARNGWTERSPAFARICRRLSRRRHADLPPAGYDGSVVAAWMNRGRSKCGFIVASSSANE